MDSSTGKPELVKAPVVTTTEIRNKAQENADYINNKATGGKTVVSTSTSNGKTTTTYSD
jgi:UDP-N-acetylmuramyl tripeptide synthase